MSLFTIKTSAGENVNIVPATEEKFPGRLLHFAEALCAEDEDCEMLFQKVGLRRSDFWLSQYKTVWERSFAGIVGQPVMEAHITLKGGYHQSLGRNHKSWFQAGHCNLSGAPFMENKVLFPEDGEYVTFDIHPSFSLLENLSEDFHRLEEFLNNSINGCQHLFSLYQTPICMSSEMNCCVIKILDYLQGPDPNRSFVEVLVQDLLILLLLRSEETKELNWKPGRSDIDALHYARDLILDEAEQKDDEALYDTAIQLADKVGLSLYKFKTGFKHLFGVPPYHLLVEARLYKARRLLKTTPDSLMGIAMKTGYNSAEAFGRAYKKLFSISPSEERK